jgi:hypothetical protein
MNSSQKGSAFERKICKQLSLWWTQGKMDDVFWRTSGSGARAAVRGKAGKGSTAGGYGDICAMHPIGRSLLEKFVFEIKRGYNKITINDIFEGKKTGIESFFGQASKSCQDSPTATKSILIHKADRKQALLYIQMSDPDMFAHNCLSGYKKASDEIIPSAVVQFHSFGRNIDIEYLCCKLDDFFRIVSPSSFCRFFGVSYPRIEEQ